MEEIITTKKLDDFTLEITCTPQSDPIIRTYDRGFLEEQLKSIQQSKDDFDTVRDIEIAEVQKLLDFCDQSNIIVKPQQEVIFAQENKV